MLSLPQKAMAGLASALVFGALVPSAASASLFRFGISGDFKDFSSPGESFTDDIVKGLIGGSFVGEVTAEGLPASGSNIPLTSWNIDLLDAQGISVRTLSSGGSANFQFGQLFSANENRSVDSLNFTESGLGLLQIAFEPGFVGSGSIITDNPRIPSGYSVFEFDPSSEEPSFFFRGAVDIASGFAELISGPIFGNIDFTFDKTVATLESPPTLVEREAGLSVEDLSYSLTAPTTELQEFSWNATRDISVSWTESSFARIFGSTTISLNGAASDLESELEFFVRGLLNDDPFDLFTTSLSLADGASQLVEWDLSQIVDLVPGDYTLALTSGVRWQPTAPGSMLTVSSEYGTDVAPIPTPALLPGLIGMGVAALRKRRQKGVSNLDENLI